MGQLTDSIAGISLTTILLILATLTAARWSLIATRVAVLRSIADFIDSIIIAIALVFLVLRPFVVQSFHIPSGSMLPTLRQGDHILVNKWVYRSRPPQRGEVIVFRAPKEASPEEKEFIKRVIGLPGDVVEVCEGYVQVVSRTQSTVYTGNEIRSELGVSVTVDQMMRGSLPPLRLTKDAVFLNGRRVSKEEFARAVGKAGAEVRIQPGRILLNDRMLAEYYVAEDPHYHLAPRTVPSGHLFVLGDNRNQSHDSRVWGMLPLRRVIGRAEFIFWPLPHAKRIGKE